MHAYSAVYKARGWNLISSFPIRAADKTLCLYVHIVITFPPPWSSGLHIYPREKPIRAYNLHHPKGLYKCCYTSFLMWIVLCSLVHQDRFFLKLRFAVLVVLTPYCVYAYGKNVNVLGYSENRFYLLEDHFSKSLCPVLDVDAMARVKIELEELKWFSQTTKPTFS